MATTIRLSAWVATEANEGLEIHVPLHATLSGDRIQSLAIEDTEGTLTEIPIPIGKMLLGVHWEQLEQYLVDQAERDRAFEGDCPENDWLEVGT